MILLILGKITVTHYITGSATPILTNTDTATLNEMNDFCTRIGANECKEVTELPGVIDAVFKHFQEDVSKSRIGKICLCIIQYCFFVILVNCFSSLEGLPACWEMVGPIHSE